MTRAVIFNWFGRENLTLLSAEAVFEAFGMLKDGRGDSGNYFIGLTGKINLDIGN